ncbi:hypothetical protein VTO42DRAFT_4116 [Malbranchea cinnamomea]
MAPIRHYLRISRYSVLECRIYLENPSDSRWLLDSRDPVLPRIFERIRPLVLPKLREENERARTKKKSKPVKDVLVDDDFEVSIFLREAGTRHSIMTRHKIFENRPRITSDSTKLTGTEDTPVDVEVGDTPIPLEDQEETSIRLQDIPEAVQDESENTDLQRRKRKRVDSPPQDGGSSDEKKLGFHTTYQGFSIWGWVLCLIISRKDKAKTRSTTDSNQALMEEWICTQAPQEYDET